MDKFKIKIPLIQHNEYPFPQKIEYAIENAVVLTPIFIFSLENDNYIKLIEKYINLIDFNFKYITTTLNYEGIDYFCIYADPR